MNANKQGLIISNTECSTDVHWRGQFMCWFMDHDIPGCITKKAESKYKYELSDCLI